MKINNWDCYQESNTLRVACGMNARYHQYLSFVWYWIDRILKIAVAGCAVWGIAWSSPDKTLDVVCLIVSIALNVVPANEREEFYKDLFQRWLDLKYQSDQLFTDSREACKERPEAIVEPELAKRLEAIRNKMLKIERDEPHPISWLLVRAQLKEQVVRGMTPVPTWWEWISSSPIHDGQRKSIASQEAEGLVQQVPISEHAQEPSTGDLVS